MSQNGKVYEEIPNAEVEPRAGRRHYTSEYKQRILDEIDGSQIPGEIGAILRREGLYSQIISKWRQQRQRGELAGTTSTPRGPKPNPQAGELAQLQQENERLRARLVRAEAILEVQKKVSQLLGLVENDPGGVK
jgi:transposase-like protein